MTVSKWRVTSHGLTGAWGLCL